nr:uncharacterized protein CFP56_43988 [Quercus suber]
MVCCCEFQISVLRVIPSVAHLGNGKPIMPLSKVIQHGAGCRNFNVHLIQSYKSKAYKIQIPLKSALEIWSLKPPKTKVLTGSAALSKFWFLTCFWRCQRAQGIADSLFFSSSKMESFENILEGIMVLGRKPQFPDLMGEKLCWSVDPVNVPVSNGPVKRCTTSWKVCASVNTNVVKGLQQLKVFRKTLMKSLQEDENSAGPPVVVSNVQSHSSLSSALQIGDYATVPTPRFTSVQSEMSEVGNSFVEDHATDALRPHISHGLRLASQTSTPWLTPPGSPPSLSVSVSPI